MDNVGKTGNVVLALLDNGQSKDGEVHANDASTDGLSLALTRAARAVAGVAIGEEKSDTSRVHNTLLHGETLLVVASSDLEDVALPLVANAVTGDLVAHTALHEDAETALIFNFDQLLRAVGRVGDVELHFDCREAKLLSGGVESRSLLAKGKAPTTFDVAKQNPRNSVAVESRCVGALGVKSLAFGS